MNVSNDILAVSVSVYKITRSVRSRARELRTRQESKLLPGPNQPSLVTQANLCSVYFLLFTVMPSEEGL